MAVRYFLALDTEWSPGHGHKPLRTDVFLAMQAHTERTFVDTAQRSARVSKQIGFTVEVADGQLAFCRVLNFIECVSAFLDRDSLAVSQKLLELCLLCLQGIFKFIQFTFCHLTASPISFLFFRSCVSILFFFRTPTTSLQRLDALLFEKVQLYDCFRESFLRIRATLSVIDEDRIGCLQPST